MDSHPLFASVSGQLSGHFVRIALPVHSSRRTGASAAVWLVGPGFAGKNGPARLEEAPGFWITSARWSWSGNSLPGSSAMLPNPDNNPDKVSGFTRHRAAVKFCQISCHVGGILQSKGRSFSHPAKMVRSLAGQLPGHFVRIALPLQSSRQFSRQSVVRPAV